MNSWNHYKQDNQLIKERLKNMCNVKANELGEDLLPELKSIIDIYGKYLLEIAYDDEIAERNIEQCNLYSKFPQDINSRVKNSEIKFCNELLCKPPFKFAIEKDDFDKLIALDSVPKWTDEEGEERELDISNEDYENLKPLLINCRKSIATCLEVNNIPDINKKDFTWVTNLGFGDCLFAAVENYKFMESNRIELRDGGNVQYEVTSLSTANAEEPGSSKWNEKKHREQFNELMKRTTQLRIRTSEYMKHMGDEIFSLDLDMSLKDFIIQDPEVVENIIRDYSKPLFRSISSKLENTTDELNDFISYIRNKYPTKTIKLNKKDIGAEKKINLRIVSQKGFTETTKNVLITDEHVKKGKLIISAEKTEQDSSRLKELEDLESSLLSEMQIKFNEQNPLLYDKYVEFMGNPEIKVWGGQAEIFAISKLERRSVLIYARKQGDNTVYTNLFTSAIYPGSELSPIILCLRLNSSNGRGSHYECLFPKELGKPSGHPFGRTLNSGGAYKSDQLLSPKILFKEPKQGKLGDSDEGESSGESSKLSESSGESSKLGESSVEGESSGESSKICRKLEDKDIMFSFEDLYEIALDCDLTHDSLFPLLAKKMEFEDRKADITPIKLELIEIINNCDKLKPLVKPIIKSTRKKKRYIIKPKKGQVRLNLLHTGQEDSGLDSESSKTYNKKEWECCKYTPTDRKDMKESSFRGVKAEEVVCNSKPGCQFTGNFPGRIWEEIKKAKEEKREPDLNEKDLELWSERQKNYGDCSHKTGSKKICWCCKEIK